MRRLADENIPGRAITFLRSSGENVTSVSEVAKGSTDEQVMARARADGRILLSFDGDHGDLIFHARIAPPAVVYLRIVPWSPEAVDSTLERLIELGAAALMGEFTVVSTEGMRQRALPGT